MRNIFNVLIWNFNTQTIEEYNVIRHLTTAVLVWVLAALGSLISLGYLFESLMITGIIYIILKIKILK